MHSQSLYPLVAGSKSDSTSRRAAKLIDANPDRKFDTYIRLTIAALLEPKVIDELGDEIGSPLLYTRPRGSELIALGVLKHGLMRISATHGRHARIHECTDDLLVHVARANPDDLAGLREAVGSFIAGRIVAAKRTRGDMARGAV